MILLPSAAEDHVAISEPPAWLETCQNLQKSCSGHHLPRDPMKLCERETKWSEQFLENMHNDLKSKCFHYTNMIWRICDLYNFGTP